MAAFHSLPSFSALSCSVNWLPAGAALLIFTLPSEAACVCAYKQCAQRKVCVTGCMCNVCPHVLQVMDAEQTLPLHSLRLHSLSAGAMLSKKLSNILLCSCCLLHKLKCRSQYFLLCWAFQKHTHFYGKLISGRADLFADYSKSQCFYNFEKCKVGPGHNLVLLCTISGILV